MLKKLCIIPIYKRMIMTGVIMIKTEMMVFTMITMIMMMVMMTVIMIIMMITMTMTMNILHIIYCIVFMLLISQLLDNSMTRVKFSCFYLFNREMWKSLYKFGIKQDFGFIFSPLTPIITASEVANPAKSFAVMRFLSKLSPKCKMSDSAS